MKYTIEITISGCSTNCAHCYVDGGIDKCMSLCDFKQCIEKIKPLLNKLGKEATVTLGNELFCHPNIKEILKYCLDNLCGHFSYSNYYVPTTGIALLNKKDKYEILELLKKSGATGFMLALHGDKINHNAIVNNSIAYEKIFETAKFVMDNGFDVLYNIIVSKRLVRNFEETLTRIQKVGGKARLTIPVFVPTERMRAYQQIRANTSDCYEIVEIAERFGIDTTSIIEHCKQHNEIATTEKILSGNFDYEKEKDNSPNWIFINITKDLNLYYGNVGSHTKYLGNIKHLSEEEINKLVVDLEPNYDYTSYFHDKNFKSLDKYFKLIKPNDLVYPSITDCIYNVLDKCGVQNLIIK
ncbi:MAG: radical SAM protein [Clostridia bacterium]|nr:radical SAM protein [Clostridia bacterium]